MKTARILIALLLLAAMTVALVGCGQTADPAPASTPAPGNVSANSTDGFGDYKVGLTILGSGSWTIDLYTKYCERYFQELGGSEVMPVSANFSSDQMVKDMQNQVAAGVDAQLWFNVFATLTPTASELFEENEVYWACYNMMILENDLDLVNANPYYCGSVGEDSHLMAYALGEKAAEMGYKKAALIGGPVGDTIHDTRINSFTEAFEAGGGEVIAVARCADPSEAPQKSDDVIAAYGDELDCFYAINMDFALSAIHAADNYGADLMFFASDCDSEALELVRQGRVITDSNISSDVLFAVPLLFNALDGHKIVDENGNAPYFKSLLPYTLTEDKLDDYKTYWLDNETVVPMDEWKSLFYRFNEDVSYEHMLNMQEEFDLDWVMAHQ